MHFFKKKTIFGTLSELVMIDIITYLSKYREEEPKWIGKYLRREQITFKDIMCSRVAYYPGSGDDGSLIKIGNKSHSVHSFLYVDYGVRREDLERRIANSILGYHPIELIEWQKYDISSGVLDSLTTKGPRFGNPEFFFVKDEKPYYLSAIMERDKERDDSWGAQHFVVTFLFADGIDTYEQLFVKEYAKAPWLFLLQDHGWGGNYDCFGAGGKLDRIIRKSRCYPSFVICAKNTRIWRMYEQVLDVASIFYGMYEDRRDLYKYIEF